MVVYPVKAGEKIELVFVSERIYLRRNGTTSVTVDVLVRNTGTHEIDCLRVLLPYAFVDIRNPGTSDVRRAASVFRKFCKKQLRKIRIRSEQLKEPSDRSNWIYDGKTVPHMLIEHGAKSTIEINRFGQENGTPSVNGYIKRNWHVNSPTKVNEWMWFLLTVNQITLVDLVAPAYDKQEPLQPNENMWLRLEFTLPATGINEHSWVSRLLSPSLEYRQWFSSQEMIRDDVQKRISNYRLSDVTNDENILASLHEAKKELPKQFPDATCAIEVKDWRLFLYAEYGLAVAKIDSEGGDPKRPNKTDIYYLPLNAYPKLSRLGWAPSWLYRWFHRKSAHSRVASCHEFWIGTNHNCTDQRGYKLGISLRLTSDFLIWAGFLLSVIALLVAVLHFAAHRFHWFGLQ